MEKHPLKNYFALLENNGLKRLSARFFDSEYFCLKYLAQNSTIEWKEDEKCYLISDSIGKDYKLNIEDYIKQTISTSQSFFKDNFREISVSKSDSELATYAMRISKEINILIQNLKSSNENGKDNALESLNSILGFLSIYNKDIQQNSIPMSQVNNKKLKWLGKINTLVTLFFDLSQDSNNLKTPLIEYDRQTLTDFIVANFTDNKGHKIEESTVYRILDANPHDFKKAKKRIEITPDD